MYLYFLQIFFMASNAYFITFGSADPVRNDISSYKARARVRLQVNQNWEVRMVVLKILSFLLE
jgi:hypothetical protein